MKMAETVSFAEHTCWNDEDFRSLRKPVVFRLYSVGLGLGSLLNVEFTADYGIWYDQDDSVLMYYLRESAPHVNWDGMVFFRKWDHSSIEIFNAETEEYIARVEVRRGLDDQTTDDRDDLGANVVRMTDWKAAHQSDGSPSSYDELILELKDVYVGPAEEESPQQD